MAQPDNTVI